MYPSQKPHLSGLRWQKVLWKKKLYAAKYYCCFTATFVTEKNCYPPAYPLQSRPRTAPGQREGSGRTASSGSCGGVVGDTVTPINHAIIVLGSPAARGQYEQGDYQTKL